MCTGGIHLDCPEQVETGAADYDKEWLQPIEKGESNILSLIFLLTAFHKAGKILRIIPNFTLSLKPETPYLRRKITEHLGEIAHLLCFSEHSFHCEVWFMISAEILIWVLI